MVAAGITRTGPGEKPPSPAAPPKLREARLGASSFRSRPHALSAALVVAGGAIMAFAILRTMAVGHSWVPRYHQRLRVEHDRVCCT